MPAKDLYHETVKNALIKEQWRITHDPLTLKLGKKDFYVDLGASRLLAAQKLDQKIAVEIKSFTGRSDIDDLEKALGQYVLYQDVLTLRILDFGFWILDSLGYKPHPSWVEKSKILAALRPLR